MCVRLLAASDYKDNGTNPEKYQRLVFLRNSISSEYLTLKTEQWNEIVLKTDTERNSKDLWTSIKRKMGTGIPDNRLT